MSGRVHLAARCGVLAAVRGPGALTRSTWTCGCGVVSPCGCCGSMVAPSHDEVDGVRGQTPGAEYSVGESFPAPRSLASIGSVRYRLSVAGLVRRAGRSRLDGKLPLPMENFRWKINLSGRRWASIGSSGIGIPEIEKNVRLVSRNRVVTAMAGPVRIPGRWTRKKCLPPPRRRGRMILRRLADGRPAAHRRQPTAAHEQTDAREAAAGSSQVVESPSPPA
jgi:hypothetical protein